MDALTAKGPKVKKQNHQHATSFACAHKENIQL